MYDTLYISPKYFLHMPINKLQPDIQIIDKINTQIYQICKVFTEKHKLRLDKISSSPYEINLNLQIYKEAFPFTPPLLKVSTFKTKTN